MKILYKNKNWLIDQYKNQQKSTVQIAKECKRNRGTIYHWLVKFDVLRRHIGRLTNHCKLTPELLERINGQLLGDAGLYPKSQYSAHFRWNQKYKEFAQYIKNTFAIHGINGGEVHKYKDRNAYQFQTYSYVQLLPLRQKWYPNGKKIVPEDIKLTPTTCQQWYLGDGCLHSSKRGRSYIRLSTDDFSIKDVKFLVSKLNDLGFKATRQGNSKIGISTETTKEFLDYIGEYPVNCYKNRWNYQDNRKGRYTRRIGQYNLEGDYITRFEGIKEAGRKTGINYTYIIEVCKNRRKTAGGFMWQYT